MCWGGERELSQVGTNKKSMPKFVGNIESSRCTQIQQKNKNK